MIEKAELTDNAMNQIVEVVKPILEKKDKEIERLNNIIEKVLFILEHMKDDRVGYEVCIDLLKGEDKE